MSEAAEVFFLSRATHGARGLEAAMSSEIDLLPPHPDSRLPSATLVVHTNALSVLLVLELVGVAQVGAGVVQLVAVDVIGELSFWRTSNGSVHVLAPTTETPDSVPVRRSEPPELREASEVLTTHARPCHDFSHRVPKRDFFRGMNSHRLGI